MDTELHRFVEAAGCTLLHTLWQATAIALACAGTLHWMRRRSPQARYALLCIGLFGILTASVVTLASYWSELKLEQQVAATEHDRFKTLPAKEITATPIVFPTDANFPPNTRPLPASPASTPDAPSAATAESPASGEAEARSNQVERALPWVIAVWLIGVALLSLRFLANWWCLYRWRSTAVTLADQHWRGRFAQLKESMRISRTVRVLTSTSEGVPMVIGWLKPVILVPAGLFAGLSATQLEAILAHELAHVRRHDYLVNLVQNAAETLLFFHPAVWWLSAEIRGEREHCCDDVAAAQCGGAVKYATALAALEDLRGYPELTPTHSISATGGSLLQRVRRLLGEPVRRPAPGISWPTSIALALLASGWLIGSHLAQAAPDTMSPADETQNSDPSTNKNPKPPAAAEPTGVDHVASGKIMSPQVLAKLPFGPVADNCLRVARFFDPMRSTYELGEKVDGRIVFHNTGKRAVEFTTVNWHQRDTWHCQNATGEPVKPSIASRMGRRSYPTFRLAPDETCEVGAQGVKIGSVPYDDEPGEVFWTVDLPVEAGETLTCWWDVTLKLAGEEEETTLRSGEVTFKTKARPENFPVELGLSRHLGKFHLAEGIKLQRSSGRRTTATIEWQGGREHEIELAHGGDLEPIVWRRGGEALWIVGEEKLRKIDFSDPGAVKELAWPWEEVPATFGGAPELVREEIDRIRPDVHARLEIREPGEYQLPDGRVNASVTTEDGRRELRNELHVSVTNARGEVITGRCALPFGENTWAVLISKDKIREDSDLVTILTSWGAMQFGFRSGRHSDPGFAPTHTYWQISAADLAAGRRPQFTDPEIIAWAKRAMPEIEAEDAYARQPHFEIRLVCEGNERVELVRPTFWNAGGGYQRRGRFVNLGQRLLRGDDLESAGVGVFGVLRYLYRTRETSRAKYKKLREQFAGRTAAVVVRGMVTDTFTLSRDGDSIQSFASPDTLPPGSEIAPFLNRTLGDWDEMLSGSFPTKEREVAQGLGFGKAAVVIPDEAIPMLLALVEHGHPISKCRSLGTLRKLENPSDQVLETVFWALGDPDSRGNRSRAGYLLADYASRRAEIVPRLIKLLENDGSLEQESAARALGHLGAAAQVALPALEAVRSRAAEPLREMVDDAIGKIRAAPGDPLPGE